MSGAHSVLPPSGAAAWRRCGAWVAMNQAFPQGDTPESKEGTAAHWVFAEMLQGVIVSEGMIAPNGVIVTEEMVEGAQLFVDTVRARIPAGAELHVEEPVACPAVHPQNWGTPDLWAFVRETMTIEVVDYKFGHRFVDEFENDQCVDYTSGILDKVAAMLGAPVGQIDHAVRVNITIVQPRCFYRGAPVRTWSVVASDLRAQINILSNAAAVAMGPNPSATTNAECRDCPGRAHCPALQMGAYADSEFATRSAVAQLPPAAASLELRFMERALERLQSRVDGMREVVTQYGKQGAPLPFHKLEQGYGRQQWTMPVDQVLAVGSLMGVDLSKPGAMTPKQAAKAGVDESVIKAYSITPAGSVKLIPCNPTDARRVFGNN